MAINRVNITGNLTRDPELRAAQTGNSVMTFGVAVNDRRRDPSTGEWTDYPNFVDCVVFGNRADALSRILTKGAKVAVEGKLHWSSWEKDGQRRSKIEVYVDEVELMSQRQQNGQQAAQQAPRAPQQQRYANPQQAPQMPSGYAAAPGVYQQAIPQQPQQPVQQQDFYSDDIPF